MHARADHRRPRAIRQFHSQKRDRQQLLALKGLASSATGAQDIAPSTQVADLVSLNQEALATLDCLTRPVAKDILLSDRLFQHAKGSRMSAVCLFTPGVLVGHRSEPVSPKSRYAGAGQIFA